MSTEPVDIVLPSAQRLRYQRLSSGIFDVTVGETEALPKAAAPFYNFFSDFRLIEQTGLIMAKPGLTFGTSFVLSSDDFGEFIPMTWITRFPAGGVVSGDGTVFECDRMSCDVPNRAVTFQSYTFEQAWEMVPGEWVFEIWCEEQRIADHAFTVMTAVSPSC